MNVGKVGRDVGCCKVGMFGVRCYYGKNHGSKSWSITHISRLKQGGTYTPRAIILDLRVGIHRLGRSDLQSRIVPTVFNVGLNLSEHKR